MHDHEIGHLTEAQIDRAYALLVAALPDVTLAEWRDYARAVIDGRLRPGTRRLIMVATDERGHLAGLGGAALGEGAGDPVLDVPVFLVLTLAARVPVERQLETQLLQWGRARGCRLARFWTPTAEAFRRHMAAAPPLPGHIERVVAIAH